MSDQDGSSGVRQEVKNAMAEMIDDALALRGARFPGRYLQGPGAINQTASEAAAFATVALVLLDGGVFDLFAPRLRDLFDGAVKAEILRFGGESSEAAIAEVTARLARSGAGVVIGVGGGKALDTAKAAAFRAGLPLIIVPTIAASDAPCSALSVIYNEDGSVDRDLFLPRNPDLVLVDTAIIAQAPPRFLAAGIGDALATWYEAESCRKSGAKNCLGLPGLPVAYAIARECREAVLTFGREALAECDTCRPGPAIERVVEANILLSGLGFESGGVAAAHAIHHGLTELEEVHHALHGEKVAIGILAGLLLNGESEEFDRIRRFLAEVRLPVSLADIGIVEVNEEKLQRVARRACRAGEIIHNEPFAVTEAMVVKALRTLT
jgi:glycerol dehydrogenase